MPDVAGGKLRKEATVELCFQTVRRDGSATRRILEVLVLFEFTGYSIPAPPVGN